MRVEREKESENEKERERERGKAPKLVPYKHHLRCVVIFTKKADGTSSFYACYAVSRRQHNNFYLFHSANKIARVRQTTKNYNHQLHAQIHVSFLSSFAPHCISFRTSVYILVQIKILLQFHLSHWRKKIQASHRAFSLHPFNFHVDIADQTSAIVGLLQKCLNALKSVPPSSQISPTSTIAIVELAEQEIFKGLKWTIILIFICIEMCSYASGEHNVSKNGWI